MNLAVVTFHIDTADSGAAGSVHPNANLERRQYLHLIDLMFRSARLQHPACRPIILSNEETDLAPLDERYEVWRVAARPESLMFDRARAMSTVVRAIGGESSVVFLDSDILLNAPLDPLLGEEFDVALTYRDHPKHPINGGVIAVRPRNVKPTLAFFDAVLRTYDEQHSEARKWFGDQDAILDVIGRSQFAARTSDRIDVEGCMVQLLPCDTYNFSPDATYESIRTPLTDRVILHFKGERKYLMPLFWDAYLGLREDPRMGSWLRAVGSRLQVRFRRSKRGGRQR